MKWEVEGTGEFSAWFTELSSEEREDVIAVVDLLEARGPRLQYPYSSAVRGSRYGYMRKLRIQHAGRPYRTLYAFDPRRSAILLLGGNKTGMNDGMSGTSRLRITCTTNTCRNSKTRVFSDEPPELE